MLMTVVEVAVVSSGQTIYSEGKWRLSANGKMCALRKKKSSTHTHVNADNYVFGGMFIDMFA